MPDTSGGLSEAGLALCSEPDVYCTPANPCGLDPLCKNGVCVVKGMRDCDDGVSCTDDRCIPGGCDHTVKDGFCLIDQKCYAKGTKAGCGRCQPEVSKTRWSPLDGVPCDDSNPCTKGDECNQGLCVGQTYSCTDSLACTKDSCDGMGGCKSLLDPAYCLIEKACYRNGETDSTQCKVCDVAVSQHDWQTRVNVCDIDGTCYAAGAKDSSGCFTCEPSHKPDGWTFLPDLCLISQVCMQKGSLHPSGCASCSPLDHATAWTPVSGATLVTHDFDQGLEGYTTSPTVGQVGWQLGTARYRSSPSSLYYGDPATQSYDNGAANNGTATTPVMQLPAKQKAYLGFQLYMDTETTASYDLLVVRVQNQVVWSKATNMKTGDFKKWIAVNVDLSAFAGQSVQVSFHFDTKDEQNNQLEGVYIDDVTLFTNCGEP